MTTTDVAVKESSGALANPADLKAWGEQVLSSHDIIIPRLLVVQKSGDLSEVEGLDFGDIVDGLDEIALVSEGQELEILPFKLEKVWKQCAIKGGKTLNVLPIVENPKDSDFNDDLVFEGGEVLDGPNKGEKCKNYRALRFFAFVVEQLNKKGALPYMIEFKSTSLRAGKKLVTQMYVKNAAAGLTPVAKTYFLKSEKTQNDDGHFAVLDVKVANDTEKEHQQEAFDWFVRLNGGEAKVQEEVS